MELGSTSSYDRAAVVKLSASEMIKYRDMHKNLKFSLVNGQTLEGSVRWFDDDAIHIVTGERNEVTILKHAILFFSAL